MLSFNGYIPVSDGGLGAVLLAYFVSCFIAFVFEHINNFVCRKLFKNHDKTDMSDKEKR